MLLRTLAGAYAGQIRDYSHSAAKAALEAGTAAPIETPQPETVTAPNRAVTNRNHRAGAGPRRKER